ncbi:hypothetical protein MBLNU230_g2825t1 [Neophaeotheca triangularis]
MSTNKTYETIVRFQPKQAVTDGKGYIDSTLSNEPTFVAYDNAFSHVLGDEPQLVLVEGRSDRFAHEAGVYIKSNNTEWFSSNYQTGKAIEIYKIDCSTQSIQLQSLPGVVHANGACNYRDKVLWCAQGSLTAPSALTLQDPETLETENLLDNFHGRPFNSINDVVVHHATGDIWFTDPIYGYEQAFRPPPQLPSQVYRFRPSTGQIWCVADGFEECNGLCFSPDYSKMYITDTGALKAHATPGSGTNFSFNPRLPATIYEYDVVAGGTRLANRKMFAFCDVGVPDGIKCDEAGNVYSGCGDGVHVWSPDGTLIGKIRTDTVVGNFNFAREGMWIFGEEKLFWCRLGKKGALWQVECA